MDPVNVPYQTFALNVCIHNTLSKPLVPSVCGDYSCVYISTAYANDTNTSPMSSHYGRKEQTHISYWKYSNFSYQEKFTAIQPSGKVTHLTLGNVLEFHMIVFGIVIAWWCGNPLPFLRAAQPAGVLLRWVQEVQKTTQHDISTPKISAMISARQLEDGRRAV